MNTITKIIIGAVLIAVVFFYAGLKYTAGHSTATSSTNRISFAGRMITTTGAAGGTRTFGGVGGGLVMGTVLSNDPQGITISLQGGGSKIIFVASSTFYTTTTAGSASDVGVGDSVMISGSTNSDGSITARSIDVRPAQTN